MEVYIATTRKPPDPYIGPTLKIPDPYISSDTTKYHRIFRQLKVVQKWVGLGRVHSVMLILGRVRLSHFMCGSGWVTKFSVLGGSGPVSKVTNKYAIYMQETDYLSTIIPADKKL